MSVCDLVSCMLSSNQIESTSAQNLQSAALASGEYEVCLMTGRSAIQLHQDVVVIWWVENVGSAVCTKNGLAYPCAWCSILNSGDFSVTPGYVAAAHDQLWSGCSHSHGVAIHME